MKGIFCWDRLGWIKFLFCSLFIFLSYNSLLAQKVQLSTNLLGYANFGTINGEIGLGLSQQFSIYIQGKYNPFEYKFRSGSRQINNKQISVACGGKYWPWYSYSGWFISGQIGWMRYNKGGFFSRSTYEGDAYGVTFSGGYAMLLSPRVNMDFGVGLMGGYTSYTKYACPKCGEILKQGKKIFIAPDNILVQLSYLF